MGLIKDFKKYRRHQYFLEELKNYGISEEDLRMIPKLVANYKAPVEVKPVSDSIAKENKDKFDGATVPADLIKIFDQDVIRLGRDNGKENNN